MATRNSTQASHGVPPRHLIAAGIKRPGQPWQVEQPQQSAVASPVRRPAMTA